ncbi:MAG: reverse transcriptase family protein, partial [Bacteroidota bacterium]
SNGEYVLETTDSFRHKYDSFVAASLFRSDQNSTVPCRILNVTPKPVKLWKGTKVGHISSLSIDQVASLNTIKKSEDIFDSYADEDPDDIVFNVNKIELSQEQQQKLQSILRDNVDIFANSLKCTDKLTSEVEHRIVVDKDATPIKSRPYKTDMEGRKEIKRQVEEMKKQGIIEESSSPWSSPVLLVKKKDGTKRFVIDFRKINAITKKDAFPIPNIDEILSSLNGSCYFSTVDLISGYWQIPMAKGSKEYTAFSCSEGLFQFRKLPFGLTNALLLFNVSCKWL